MFRGKFSSSSGRKNGHSLEFRRNSDGKLITADFPVAETPIRNPEITSKLCCTSSHWRLLFGRCHWSLSRLGGGCLLPSMNRFLLLDLWWKLYEGCGHLSAIWVVFLVESRQNRRGPWRLDSVCIRLGLGFWRRFFLQRVSIPNVPFRICRHLRRWPGVRMILLQFEPCLRRVFELYWCRVCCTSVQSGFYGGAGSVLSIEMLVRAF